MSSIEWTEKTWNPTVVCERLEIPLRTRKPTTWFVNSMPDLFHESGTDDQLDQIFAVMALTPHHTYQCLTKRPKQMLEYFSADIKLLHSRWTGAAIAIGAWDGIGRLSAWTEIVNAGWPLPNVWLGVSVKNQKAADERIPLLLQTPAAVRFLSCEPLLEGISLDGISLTKTTVNALTGKESWMLDLNSEEIKQVYSRGIDWVIVGGESGSKARPCDVEWIRSIVQQCKDAEVPVMVKQLGSNAVNLPVHCGSFGRSKGKMNFPAEWPQDLRVRQYPGDKP